MRKHKYRAWNKRDKIMECLDFLNLSPANFCGQYYVAPPEDLFGVATRKGNLLSLDEVILMQYSGIEDNSNKEIFEGDIVKIQHYHDKRKYINGEVKFSDGSFIVDVVDMESLLSCERNSIKVVGNIYENPELLEVA